MHHDNMIMSRGTDSLLVSFSTGQFIACVCSRAAKHIYCAQNVKTVRLCTEFNKTVSNIFQICYRPFSHCIDQAGLGAFTAKSGRKHYNPPPLTVM